MFRYNLDVLYTHWTPHWYSQCFQEKPKGVQLWGKGNLCQLVSLNFENSCVN